MQGPLLRAGSPIEVFTADERPDLWERGLVLSNVWPEYNGHGNHTAAYFGALIPRHDRFQLLLYDGTLGRVWSRGGERSRFTGTARWGTSPGESTLWGCA